MNGKVLGGIFVIAGTSIGGGMLGLPVVTAQSGFWHASILFIACWALMTFTAFLTLEINLCFPSNSNVISMAGATLGRTGQFISWTIYLLFLYALVSAYISAGEDLINGLLAMVDIKVALWVCGIFFVLVFGTIVMTGIHMVDWFNRFLMAIKLMTLLILIAAIVPHIQMPNYAEGHFSYLLPAVTVAITSFGFSIVVPSLRHYLDGDVKKLRLTILIGSLIPLLCYIAWIAVIFGGIPLQGQYGLQRLTYIPEPITGLLISINYFVHSHLVSVFSHLFTSICILTAFLCVSLGLSDYIADGVKKEKRGVWRPVITALTFIPPLLIVVLYPKAFILFLSIAGFLCVILQALMPTIMVWRARYHHNIVHGYQVFGGRLFLVFAFLGSLAVAGIALYEYFL